MQLEKGKKKKTPRQQPIPPLPYPCPELSQMKKCYYSTTCMHTARSAPVGSMSARKPHQRLAGQAAVTPATLWTTNPIPALWTPQQGSTRRRMQGAISHPASVCEAPIAVGCADAIHEPCSRSADGGARQAACAAAERRPSTCGSGTAKSDADIIDWTMTSRFVGDRNLTATAKVQPGLPFLQVDSLPRKVGGLPA